MGGLEIAITGAEGEAVPKNRDTEKAQLEKKLAQIQARLQGLNAAEQTQKRKADARRKLVYGAEALNLAADDPAFAKLMRDRLERNLTRSIDRRLFGLVDLPEKESKEGQEVKAEGERNQPDG
jgi:hypothetical protein